MNKEKLHGLFKRIKQEHESSPAKDNAQEVISNFQSKLGFTLPADLVEFYSHFHEASQFEEVFILEPLDEISQAGTVVKRAECERLHVPYGVMCARHHLAMLDGDPPTESMDSTPIYEPSRPWNSTH